jgi:hypothetical protein
VAKATKTNIPAVPQRVPFKVTLELDMNEAIMLRSVFRLVGGKPDAGTGRYYTDRIQTALRQAGVPYINDVNAHIEGRMYIGDSQIADLALVD